MIAHALPVSVLADALTVVSGAGARPRSDLRRPPRGPRPLRRSTASHRLGRATSRVASAASLAYQAGRYGRGRPDGVRRGGPGRGGRPHPRRRSHRGGEPARHGFAGVRRGAVRAGPVGVTGAAPATERVPHRHNLRRVTRSRAWPSPSSPSGVSSTIGTSPQRGSWISARTQPHRVHPRRSRRAGPWPRAEVELAVVEVERARRAPAHRRLDLVDEGGVAVVVAQVVAGGEGVAGVEADPDALRRVDERR
jgi:hypothetical protein